MIELVASKSKSFETTDYKEQPLTVLASFNGKIYNGKRYINCQYRLGNTRNGLKKATFIWQDDFGWVEGGVWDYYLEDIFDLSLKKDAVISFGKHEGKKLSEVPASYLKWLVSHKNVLKSEHQAVIEDVKAFLA